MATNSSNVPRKIKVAKDGLNYLDTKCESTGLDNIERGIILYFNSNSLFIMNKLQHAMAKGKIVMAQIR